MPTQTMQVYVTVVVEVEGDAFGMPKDFTSDLRRIVNGAFNRLANPHREDAGILTASDARILVP